MRHITFTKWVNILLIAFLCFTACQSESKKAPKAKAKTAQKSTKANKKKAKSTKKKSKSKSKKVPYKALKKDKSGKMTYNGEAFTGMTFKSVKGKTTAEINYKDGVKHGSYISYKGGKKTVTEFKNGKKIAK